MRRFWVLLTMMVALPAGAQQILPQEYRGADGKYEMCIKRHILELREARGEAMMPNDEIASAIVGCKKLRSRGAEDVLATIRECGVAVGDGSPEQECPH